MKIRDLQESKNLSSEKDSVSPGVQQLKTDQYMGMYKFSKDVAGHDGKKQHAPKSEPNKVYKDAPVVVGYSDVDDKMTKAAMKGKVKQTVAAGSKEPPAVNKHSPLSKNEDVAEGKKCPQCGSTSCTCEPGKCNCKPVEEDKIKGKDGKACWKGYRYGGTKDGKDVCIKVREATGRHDRYIRSHGKKASGGHGAWMFTNKEYGEPGKDEIFTAPPGKFSDAAKHAAKWAKQKGHHTVYAMEAVVSEGVIYQLDPANPMDDTEVLVLGGAGRYTLKGLRTKARREAAALAKDLEAEHGGAFRGAAYNIKQLVNTLNTIVAAYDELTDIRKKGGAKSRGIRAEDAKLFSESIELMEKWSQKYKNSINCSNPKGFSQKAHCAGRKK